MGTNMIIGPVIGGVPIGSLLNQMQPEVATYIDGLVTPLSAEQIGRLNTFVKTLKTGLGITALSDYFDVLYILAGETSESSLRNLVKNAHYATAVNAPVFTQFEGFNGNGTSSYINNNYKFLTQAVNYKQNDASFGVYVRDNIGSTPLGVSAAGALSTITYVSGVMYSGINSVSAGDTIGFTVNKGLFSLSRDNNANYDINFNKTKLSTIINASSGLLDLNTFTCARNNSGSPTYSTNQIAFTFYAKSISLSQRDVIVDAFEAYMDSNGKGVIA